ncbi:hypothetical protein Rhopal_001185-T1 [Rhodotorula paludigena]|uniref:Rho-GAP domain-containing protein n=1 Tax=Rhodotorula paludigena TaxID=86838 RepID=A0AAV5G6X7_9BASI|nr:hypothetical protein Rhopal_001185-T1 [Rhodotorula paludigena]
MADEVHARLLRELDHYLAFFRRRHEIEQDYVDQLKKLSLRSAQQDRALDDELYNIVPTTWRKAWLAVRTAVEDEVRSHKATADGLDRLTSTLSTFRDDRERIRRRVRDDLRTSSAEHADYRSVVQRLRKTYERRVEELQHYEEAEMLKDQDVVSPSLKPIDKEPSWPPEHWLTPELVAGRKRSDSAASSKAGASASDADSPPASVSSPGLSPVFVSGATSSSASAPSAYRDPPTAKQNVFEAIAKRDWSGEKHRVNSIVRAVGNLGKGADGGSSHGPSKPRSRQYSSKLKREAEQADRDYRSGIFQLETLRLQKMRVQTSARQSLREFVHDLASNLRSSFEMRVAEQISLGQALVAIAEHVKPEVEKVDVEQDAQDFFLNVNAFVGECKSLLFGVGLQDYHAKHPDLLVPLIVERCIANIESTGLDLEGIYRVPGKLATIQQLVHRMEKEEEAFAFGPNDDPAAVAGVLKLYLRQLPTPVFPFAPQDRKAFTNEYAASPDFALASLVRRIRRLSPPQQATLKALCQHLAKVAEHDAVNKMNASNLALIFTTVIFGEDESATLESAMAGAKDNVMETLIRQHSAIFRDLPVEPASAPRSRQGSDSVNSPEPHASTPSPASTLHILPSSHSSPPTSYGVSSGAVMPPSSSVMRNAGSVDSVYALYQHATTPGVLPDGHDPLGAIYSAPPTPQTNELATSTQTSLASPHQPHTTSSIPQVSPVAEHPPDSPLELPPRPSALESKRQDSFDGPEPPLSAALGRHIPHE